jgi:hypothetical protein
MAKMNWARQNSRSRAQRQGSEDVRGADIPFAAPSGSSGPRRRPASKTGPRLEAAAAADSSGARKVLSVSCLNCPYTAIVTIALRPDLRFRCSQCGAVGTLAKKIS